MKYWRYSIFSVFLLLTASGTSSTVLAASKNIIFSEVLIGQEKASDPHEFVELYNTSDAPLDLSSFRLRYRNSSGTEHSLAVLPSGSCIPPRGYFLWANSKGAYSSLADSSTATLLTENYTLFLYPPDEESDALDTVGWDDASLTPVGQSLTRDPETHSWLPALTPPTPTKSSPCKKEEPAPAPLPLSDALLRLSELFPNPTTNTSEEEFIELVNEGTSEMNLGGYVLRDASKTGHYTFPLETLLPAQSYLVLRRSVSKIALNNTDETLSLFDASGALVDTIRYTKTKPGVSQNRVGTGLRGGVPTPGAKNQLNILPETKEKVPKKGYRNMPISFSAQGEDRDGETLKYTWDFGDGHRSFKKTTTHTYQKNGTYSVTLTTTDGRDDVTETFSLNILSFPKPDVRIIELVPNPAGKDTDHESLLIENRSKKAIDLKGYSIATGWKKLANHTVRESFIIPPKETRSLTRTHSLFTLPNQKGKIELRSPDGTALQKIQYKLSKSVAENAVYSKQKGERWKWKEEKKSEPRRNTLPPTVEPPSEVFPEETPLPEASPDLELPQSPAEEFPEGAQSETVDEGVVLGASTNVPSSPETSPVHFSPFSPRTSWEHFFSSLNSIINNWRNQQ